MPLVAAAIVVALIQRFLLIGELRFASPIFVTMVTFTVAQSLSQSIHGTQAVWLIVSVVTAGILLGRRDFTIALVFNLIIVGLAALSQTQLVEAVTIIPAQLVQNDLVLLLGAIVIITSLMYLFSSTADDIAVEILDYDERLEWLVAYRQQLGQAQIENDALVMTSQLLTEQMLYTFSQVHLNDEEGRLFTYTRTGMGTRHTVSRANLEIENAVRVAARLQEAVLISNSDSYEQRSHLLPSVNYAAAIPLMVGGRCIGVLDVQTSSEISPFDEREMLVLRMIATELGLRLDEVRRTGELLQVNGEQETANERLQAELANLRRQLDQSLGGEWARYLRNRHRSAIGFDLSGQNFQLTPASDLPEHLLAAMRKGEMVIEQGRNEQTVNVPISRRDEMLGAMSFALPLDRKLTNRQIDMARSVANRLAVALENARLVEQSQDQVARERKAGEVANVLLGQQEVDMLLNTAAESFQQALGAIYTRIYIDPDALREEV